MKTNNSSNDERNLIGSAKRFGSDLYLTFCDHEMTSWFVAGILGGGIVLNVGKYRIHCDRSGVTEYMRYGSKEVLVNKYDLTEVKDIYERFYASFWKGIRSYCDGTLINGDEYRQFYAWAITQLRSDLVPYNLGKYFPYVIEGMEYEAHRYSVGFVAY